MFFSPSPPWLAFLVLWTLSRTVVLVNAQVLGKLGVALYKNENQAWLHYGSMIRKITDGSNQALNLNDTRALPDEALATIAYAAWEEMEKIRITRYDQSTTPTSVMVALQVGDELLLSSSLRHTRPGFAALFASTPASVALERCAITSGQNQVLLTAGPNSVGAEHTTAHCAEPLAVHAYYTKYPDQKGRLPDGARLVAVSQERVLEPCENSRDGQASVGNPKWGCARFLSDMGIRVVRPGNKKIDIPDSWKYVYSQTCF